MYNISSNYYDITARRWNSNIPPIQLIDLQYLVVNITCDISNIKYILAQICNISRNISKIFIMPDCDLIKLFWPRQLACATRGGYLIPSCFSNITKVKNGYFWPENGHFVFENGHGTFQKYFHLIGSEKLYYDAWNHQFWYII